MRVELLYVEDDPGYMAARQTLVEVLTEDAFETPIQMIAVGSDEDARLLDFRGSPTVRIDGVDLDPEWDGAVGLGRRLYQTDAGPSPVPDHALVRRAVERARGWAHGRR